jgi:carboxyl-terminal processing protease
MKLRKSLATSSVALCLALTLASAGFGGQPAAALPHDTTDADITRLTTNLLEQSQFAHHPFDDQLAGILLNRYLDSLDGAHALFLKSDVDELAPYRATLAKTTREKGDTGAARAIFDRYLQRLQERASYVDTALRTASFDFTGHDVYSLDGEHAERPRDLTAAKALWLQQLRGEYLEEKLGDKKPDEIVSALSKRYEQQARTMKAFTSDEVLEVYLNALAHVYDPHSDYFGREQMDSFSIAMSLSLVGIGATLESADGYCKIHDLVPGGPAARGGLLKPGDRIVAVAQPGHDPVDVVNMPLSRTVALIRGPKGSTVTLKVIPAAATDGAEPETLSMVRDEIKLEDQEAKARIVDLPTANGTTLRVGVIDLPSFYADMSEGEQRRSATADVTRLLGKLNAEHVQGVVLDLRRNGGGSLDEAIKLTGLFIRKGPVVQTRDPAGDIEVGADTDPSVLYDGPLVVLTSRFTASASEILAGALQDYGRALIVGDPSTFGKGTVQNVVPLARLMDRVSFPHAYDPGALKITISKFYRPSGASTQLRGVASDIVVPSTTDLSDVSESALKNPLPWDVVPPKPYDHLNQVAPYVDALRRRSGERVAAARDFTYLEDDVARLRVRLATKTVSLNESQRRLETAHDKARRDEREREARGAHVARPVTYEITLRNAGASGLPAPVDFTKQSRAAPAVGSSTKRDLDAPAPSRAHADDIVLDESERILADYAGASPGDRAAARGHLGGRVSYSGQPRRIR